ncbi:MAG: hypothetical protein JO022_15570, partial [Acidobacteriaceae bacterium]|nr:hypothetical protein [Acidobacteriaceae bacterium]
MAAGFFLYARRSELQRQASESRSRRLIAPAVVAACLAASLAILMFLSQRLGTGHPDQNAYRFQSRVIRAGHLSTESTLNVLGDSGWAKRAAFFTQHINFEGKWFTLYPPGWPSLLAAVPDAYQRYINPALGAILLVLIFLITWQISDWQCAAVAVLMACFSPYFVDTCVGYMSEPFCAVLIATAVLLYLKGIASQRVAYFAAMWLMLSAAILVRPYTGILFGIVLMAASARVLRNTRALLWAILGIGVPALAVSCAAHALVNHALTGSYLRSPYALYAGQSLPPQITFDAGSLASYAISGFRRGLLATALAVSPIFVICAAYGMMTGRSWDDLANFVLAACSVCLVIGYFVNTMPSASVVGERFYFPSFFAWIVLAAIGYRYLSGVLGVEKMRWLLFASMIVQGVCLWYLTAPLLIENRQFTEIEKAARASAHPHSVVFLKDSGQFVAKHLNLNEADWRHAPA